MRIAGLASFEFCRKLDGRAWNPAWRWHERRAPLLRITAQDGSSGIGEGWSRPGEIAAFHERVREAAPSLIGRDAGEIDAIHQELGKPVSWAEAAFASAVDVALWDLAARRRCVSLHALLDAPRDTVPVYASGGLYEDGKDRNGLAAEMRGYVARGFLAVKMKIGGLTLEDDMARLAAVRAAVGDAVEIIVDAVGQLDPMEAPRWIERLARLGVRSIQAPLADADVEGMAALQRDFPIAIIAGETEYRHAQFERLLQTRAVGMLQFCVGLCGGITGARQLIAAATAAGVEVTLQCYSTAVMQAATFHAGAVAGVRHAEYHMFHTGLYGAFPPGMSQVREGCVQLGERRGLGVDDVLAGMRPVVSVD